MSRLGHGRGYYDKFIAEYVASGKPRPLLGMSSGVRVAWSLTMSIVALSLREQVLEASEIPVGDHDWKIDVIITPDVMLVERAKES